MHLLALLLILALAPTAHAAWGTGLARVGIGTGGLACQNKTAGTSLTCTIDAEDANAGNILVMCFAGDNVATADGNDQLVTGVSDSQGNPWTLPRCFTNANNSANAGATVCMSIGTMNRTLVNASDTITATFTSITAKAFAVREFTKAATAGPKIYVAGPTDLANDGADPGSVDITAANQEHLWVRCSALERAGGGTWTVTSGHTTMNCAGTTGTPAASNMEVCGEYEIATATTNASDPTGTAVDNASQYQIIDEVTINQPPHHRINY